MFRQPLPHGKTVLTRANVEPNHEHELRTENLELRMLFLGTPSANV
jgi:hypothetical protein